MRGFKDFILRGNVAALAVAFVIGGAFGALVQGFVKDFITPLIAIPGSGPDFEGYTFTIGHGTFKYGDFLDLVIAFLSSPPRSTSRWWCRCRGWRPGAPPRRPSRDNHAAVPRVPQQHPAGGAALRLLHRAGAPGRSRTDTVAGFKPAASAIGPRGQAEGSAAAGVARAGPTATVRRVVEQMFGRRARPDSTYRRSQAHSGLPVAPGRGGARAGDEPARGRRRRQGPAPPRPDADRRARRPRRAAAVRGGGGRPGPGARARRPPPAEQDVRLLPVPFHRWSRHRGADPHLPPHRRAPAGDLAEGVPQHAAARVGAPLRLRRPAAGAVAAHRRLLRAASRPRRGARRGLRAAPRARRPARRSPAARPPPPTSTCGDRSVPLQAGAPRRAVGPRGPARRLRSSSGCSPTSRCPTTSTTTSSSGAGRARASCSTAIPRRGPTSVATRPAAGSWPTRSPMPCCPGSRAGSTTRHCSPRWSGCFALAAGETAPSRGVADRDPARTGAVQRGVRRPPVRAGAPSPGPAGCRHRCGAARVHPGGGDRLRADRGGVAARRPPAGGAAPDGAQRPARAEPAPGTLPARAPGQGDRGRGGRVGVPDAAGHAPLAAGSRGRRRRDGGRGLGGRLGRDRRLADVPGHHAGAVRSPRHALEPAGVPHEPGVRVRQPRAIP